MVDLDNQKLKEIGSRIRDLRKRKEWTIENLAFEANLTVPQISQIERGLRDAQITTYMKIADAFGVNIAVLFPPTPNDENIDDEYMEINEIIKGMDVKKRKAFLQNIKNMALLIVEH